MPLTVRLHDRAQIFGRLSAGDLDGIAVVDAHRDVVLRLKNSRVGDSAVDDEDAVGRAEIGDGDAVF